MSIVESNNEGAFDRLRQLGHDASDSTSKTPRISFGIESSQTVRLRELEELATIACAENTRLEGEVEQMRAENAALKLENTRLEIRALALTEKSPQQRAWLFAVAGAAVAALVVGLIALRPHHAPAPAIVVAAPAPVVAPAPTPTAPAPVVAAAPAPVVTAAPVEPEPTVTTAAVEPTAKAPHKKHAKHVAKAAASKKHIASAKKHHGNSDDPLAGLAL